MRGKLLVLLAGAIGCAGVASACSDGSSDATPSSSTSVLAVATETASSAPAKPVRPALDGGALVERFQCVRCHDGTRQADIAREKHCVRCHQDIGDGKFEAPPDVLADWKPHVMHLRFVPSLSGIGRLVKPEWAAKFLQRPFDLRPHAHPEMPRLAMDDAEAEAIVAYLSAPTEEAIPASSSATGDVERGRTLFEDKTCSNCHTFSGAGTRTPRRLDPGKTPKDRALAPDLRHARERLIAANVVAYIADPKSVKPDAAMPKLDMSVQDAADLAAFVLTAPLDVVPPAATPARLPVLERAVTYDEVSKKVLHKICWHCHSQPDFARGDGGPGNTGGFGFAARKLDLSSYESIASGYLSRGGERQSAFSKGTSGEPRLLEVLLARQREERGILGDVRGMPLGLPPLSAEDIQLVETWIAQGHPR